MGRCNRVFACVILLIFVLGVTTQEKVKRQGENEEETYEKIMEDPDHQNYIEANWNFTDYKLNEMIEQMMKRLMPMMIRSSSSVELSGKCMQALFKMMLALRQNKLWATRCK